MSYESFLWWDFEHAVHLQARSSQLLSAGAVRALRLALLPRREHHEGQADDGYQHAEAQQRDGYHQPGDSLFVGLFLQRHRVDGSEYNVTFDSPVYWKLVHVVVQPSYQDKIINFSPNHRSVHIFTCHRLRTILTFYNKSHITFPSII